MYKVFNQHRAIIFTESLKNCKISKEDTLIETNQLDDILPAYLKFMKGKKFGKLIFHVGNQLNPFFYKFFTNFKLVRAAGGLVVNSMGELLMIKRFSKWDLPKGKIDEGEEIENGAIRECIEETALQEMSIEKEIESTYHIYDEKSVPILKRTYWFAMTTDSDNELVPQQEEGIEEVRWMNKTEVEEALKNSYDSLQELIRHNYLQQ